MADELWSYWFSALSRVSAYAYFSVGLALLPLCVLGNITILWVFARQHKQLKGYHIPLALLALSDTWCCIYVVGLDRLVTYSLTYFYPNTTFFQVANYSSISCKLFSYTWLMFAFCSSNALLLVNAERVAALYKPFLHKVYVTKKLMTYVTVGFVILAVAANVPGLVYFDIADFGGFRACYISMQQSKWQVWSMQLYITLFINGVASNILILVLSLLMACKFISIQRHRRHNNNGLRRQCHCNPGPSESSSAVGYTTPSTHANPTTCGKSYPLKGVVTLLMLNSLYLLLTLPKCVCFFISFLSSYGYLMPNEAHFAQMFLQLACTLDLIVFTSSSYNFIIYYKRYRFFPPGLPFWRNCH